jgi:hypothetical protein
MIKKLTLEKKIKGRGERTKDWTLTGSFVGDQNVYRVVDALAFR